MKTIVEYETPWTDNRRRLQNHVGTVSSFCILHGKLLEWK